MENRITTIEEMELRLEQYGHKAIWETIEKIGQWQDRIAFRQIFFLAGGKFGENENE
jgi:hypothetical protein